MNLHLELLLESAVGPRTKNYLQKFTLEDVMLIKSQLLTNEKQESCTKQISI